MSEKEKHREGWVSVFRSSTDYEADMVRDRAGFGGHQRRHVYATGSRIESDGRARWPASM